MENDAPAFRNNETNTTTAAHGGPRRAKEEGIDGSYLDLHFACAVPWKLT